MKKVNFRRLLYLSLIFITTFIICAGPICAQSDRINTENSSGANFSGPGFVLVVKDANGKYVTASPDKLPGPNYTKGVITIYDRLKNNAEYKKMLEIHSKSIDDSQKKRLKSEYENKIKIARADQKSGKIKKNVADTTISYYTSKIKDLNSGNATPVVYVLNLNPAAKTSFMAAKPIEYTDASGKINKASSQIILQQNLVEELANNPTNLYKFNVIAHETGHSISNNSTGHRNIKIIYTDPNPYFLIDDALKSDTAVIEFVKKGDPEPSHWKRKITHPLTAFEEGFAEFSGSFFVSPKHDADNITDDDYMETKNGYKIIKNGNIISTKLISTEIVKTPEELQSTEFFVAKMLYYIATSFSDPYAGYQAIVKVKSSTEFKIIPDLNTFLSVFAREYPGEYEVFKTVFIAKFEAAVAGKKLFSLNYERKKNSIALVDGIKKLIVGAGRSGVQTAEGTSSSNKGVTVCESIEPQQQAPHDVLRPQGKTSGESIKINTLKEKLKRGDVTQ